MAAELTPAIYNAFAARFAAWADSPDDALAATLSASASETSLPVAFPGAPGGPFIPPESGLWAEVRFLPGDTFSYAYGPEGPFAYEGIFQVEISARPGLGIQHLLSAASQVVSLFPVGVNVLPARVQRRPTIASVVDEPERSFVPVSVRYAAFISTDYNPYLVIASGGTFELFLTADSGELEVSS